MGRPLPVAGRGAAVLCYHDVDPDPTNSTDYVVSPARLRAQLEAIASWGLRFVGLEEVIDGVERDTPLDGLVAVTFDDALVGVLDHALDVLLDLRVPATVFVVTDVRGVDPPFWPGAQRTMNAEELRALSAAGVRLGSHTRAHPSLTGADDDRVRDELVRSVRSLKASPASRATFSPIRSATTTAASQARRRRSRLPRGVHVQLWPGHRGHGPRTPSHASAWDRATTAPGSALELARPSTAW